MSLSRSHLYFLKTSPSSYRHNLQQILFKTPPQTSNIARLRFCYLCEHNGLLKVDGGPLKFSSNICTPMMGSSVDHRFSSFFIWLVILNIERTQPPSASITAPRRYQQLCAGKLKIFPGSEFEGNYLNRIKLPYKSTSLITNCISIAPSPHQPNTSPPPLQKTITFVQEQDVYCLLLSVLCFCSSFPLLCFKIFSLWIKTKYFEV